MVSSYTTLDRRAGGRQEFVMARLARVVIPGVTHHVTQRGNRRQEVFFCEEDYDGYLELLHRASWTRWSACWIAGSGPVPAAAHARQR